MIAKCRLSGKESKNVIGKETYSDSVLGGICRRWDNSSGEVGIYYQQAPHTQPGAGVHY